jgi:hypothetical protein
MPQRPLAFAAVLLLSISALGGLSVGIPLVVAVLSNPAHVDTRPSDALVPGVVLAYGLLSLGGAVATLLGWRRATLLVVVPQGIVALSLLTIWIGVVEDASLLIVAGIAGGAAILALLDRRTVRRAGAGKD